MPTDNEWHAGAWHSNQEQAAFEDEGAEALERPVGHFDAADGGNQHVLQSEQNVAWEQWSRAEWSAGLTGLAKSTCTMHVMFFCYGDLFLPSGDDLFLLCHFFGTYAAMTFFCFPDLCPRHNNFQIAHLIFCTSFDICTRAHILRCR